MVIASTEYASHIAEQFKLIQRRGGRAAIDYHNGELALMCTRPTDKSKDLGAWCCAATLYGRLGTVDLMLVPPETTKRPVKGALS